MKITVIRLSLLIGVLFTTACSKKLMLSKQQITQTKIDTNIVADEAILDFYKSYKVSLDSQMNSVLCISETELTKAQPESKLSNFFSDAIASTCRRKGFEFDFAMPTTNGGIRASLPKGAITMRNAFELMPFENELVILYLDGAAVQQLARFIVEKGGQPVSGIKITAAKNAEIKASINALGIDNNKTYRVLTSDYLANGGDGIVAFKEAKKRDNTNIKVRDAIIDYLREEHKAGRTLNPTLDGRIQIEQ